MYSPGDPIDWLLDVFQIADDVVLELDECTEDVSKLASYFIANAKTKWLTTHDDRVYSKLSVNRIYDMSWLWQTEGELFPNE